MLRRISTAVIAVAILTMGVGCASLSLPFVGRKADFVQATSTNPVMSVICLWQPGEGRGPDNLPSRGFAGQLMFFTLKSAEAALVDGQTTIYVFDDQGTVAEQSRPLWQHTFTTDEWRTFACETTLGVAYQLFVPYVRKGSQTALCSLRVKFEPSDGGPPVYSKMVDVRLEGSGEKPQLAIHHERIEPEPIQPAESPSEAAAGLRSASLSALRDRKVNAAAVAHLQQVAAQTVREQPRDGDVQQAGYEEPAPDESVDNGDLVEGTHRYRLYR